MVRHSWKSGGAFPLAGDSQCGVSKLGLDLVYLAFRVEVLGDAIKGIRALGNARGFSVTIPHKVAAIPFLDEVEPTAKHIGAINTIVVEDGGSRATTRTRPAPYAP